MAEKHLFPSRMWFVHKDELEPLLTTGKMLGESFHPEVVERVRAAQSIFDLCDFSAGYLKRPEFRGLLFRHELQIDMDAIAERIFERYRRDVYH